MKWLILVFIFFITYCPVNSQHLPITVYSSREGAPVVGANSVFQDSKGWMWFTTGYEVVRYDGHRFKTYHPANGSRIEFVFRVLEINKELWVLGTPEVLKLQGDSLVPLGKNSAGLYLINVLEYKQQQYLLGNQGLYVLNNDRIETIIKDSALNIGSNASLTRYNDSILITCYYERGLVLFNILDRTYHWIEMPALDLQIDHLGNIFILMADKGIVKLDKLLKVNGGDWEAETTLHVDLPIKANKLEHFLVDRHGNFWFFEQFKHLIRVTPQKNIMYYTMVHGLPSLWFNQGLIDRENNLWLAMNGGIGKINESVWERFTSNEGLSFNHPIFLTYNAGRFFIGTEKGLNVYSKGKLSEITSGGESFRCNYIIEMGTTVYYTLEKKLFKARIDTASNRIFDVKVLSSLPVDGFEMALDKGGAILIATVEGLYAWYDNRLTDLLPEKREYFRRVLADSRGMIWVGAFGGGIYRFAMRYVNSRPVLEQLDYIENNKDTPPLKLVRVIAEDNKRNILVGTRFNGLFYIEMKNDGVNAIHHFSEKNGLTSNSVWGIATDINNHAWIGTAKGLNKLAKRNGQWQLTDESRQRQIYSTGNLVSDRDKKIWVSTHPGVVSFNIDAKIASHPFTVAVTRITVEGKHINDLQKSFPAAQNNFSIEFSSNSYIDEKAIEYSYRLLRNGRNESWATTSSVHSVNFSSLRPGNYIFEVRALNITGTWSINTAAYSFRILPPFWQRPWFIGAAVLVLIAALYVLYRYRIRQIMRLQEMRNTISRNLHDDIGASLSNINILNELTKRNLNDKEKAQTYLIRSGEDIQHISESLSDIVWNINPRYDDLDNLFIRMKRYAADMMDGKNIDADLEFPEPGAKTTMSMDKRRDLYLIFKEAVNNLVKYSRADQASIRVLLESHSIEMVVQDNGKGFNNEISSNGNGIQNMKQRAEKWKAPLTIETKPGRGTSIRLKMRV